MSKKDFLLDKKYILYNRTKIIEFLIRKKNYAYLNDFIKILGIKELNKVEELHSLLKIMERNKELLFIKTKNLYTLADKCDFVQGKVIGHKDGFGFLRVDNDKEDYYISTEQMKCVIHGDLVLAKKYNSFFRKDRFEVRIITIITPNIDKIVGKLFFDSYKTSFVVPNDNRFNFKIFIPAQDINISSKEEGSIVVVQLIKRPINQNRAIGKIIEVLGKKINVDMAISVTIRNYNIPYTWPHDVKKQVNIIEKNYICNNNIINKENRVDLRTLPFITIDGEESHDFDDAVYCERNTQGWTLWVTIADVSYYVRPNTPLDKEAHKRSVSVYFPCYVIPMLPEILSNNLCSLNPKEDKLCIACEMKISNKGILSSYKFYEAIMNSHSRLTYTEAWNLLKNKSDFSKKNIKEFNSLVNLHMMYKTLESARILRGGLFFETEEIKFIFDKQHNVEKIDIIFRNDVHKIIEECMILTNVAAANFIAKNKQPALYRIHDKPNYDNLSYFNILLKKLGIILNVKDILESKTYANILSKIYKYSNKEIIQFILLRSMKQASYSIENIGHFGLALPEYTHFTSPIRRYSDLTLHRVIKYLLHKEHKNIYCTGGQNYKKKQILQFAQQCSTNERRADDATRYVDDWLKCEFIKNYIGNIFCGFITQITSFGFFVRINKFYIDGLVHVSSLHNDYYQYDHINKKLIGESSKITFCIGEKVYVRVESVSIEERKIDFSLAKFNNKTYL